MKENEYSQAGKGMERWLKTLLEEDWDVYYHDDGYRIWWLSAHGDLVTVNVAVWWSGVM